MRHFCLLALAASLAAAAENITPRIGLIEIYGDHKVSENKIRAALAVKVGDLLPSRQDAEARIDKVPGVLVSRVEAACCSGPGTILYVGVEERDAPHVQYHDAPTGDITLPASLFDGYRKLLDNVAASIRGHNADQDLTNGYSLMADPDSRELQLSFLPAVAENLALIDRVVRESADPEQRAAATYLMQYGPRGPRTNKIIINALQYALRDREDEVRENAVRALRAVAVSGKLHPEQQIRIQPTWFVELMNSVVWTDRRDATLALVNLTETHDPETLQLLRERALPSVIEMARWHDLQHALPAFILAGRLAGLDEKQIKTAWLGEDRESVLKQALSKKNRARK
ncbi:MAG TPA: hypothetical protein VGK64_03590 [Bryobacteraceae bacterium]